MPIPRNRLACMKSEDPTRNWPLRAARTDLLALGEHVVIAFHGLGRERVERTSRLKGVYVSHSSHAIVAGPTACGINPRCILNRKVFPWQSAPGGPSWRRR